MNLNTIKSTGIYLAIILIYILSAYVLIQNVDFDFYYYVFITISLIIIFLCSRNIIYRIKKNSSINKKSNIIGIFIYSLVIILVGGLSYLIIFTAAMLVNL